MDTLHTVLRSIRGETKEARRDHLAVFREFLGHLGRIGKSCSDGTPVTRGRTNGQPRSGHAGNGRRGKS